MSTSTSTIQELANKEYQYGFVTDIESESLPRGLNEDIVRMISAKKNEPEFMLEWRLKAYRHWLTMKEPSLGERKVPRHRLSEHHLLFRTQVEEGWTQELG